VTLQVDDIDWAGDQAALDDWRASILPSGNGQGVHPVEADVSIPAAETLPAFVARLRDRVHPPDVVPGLVPGLGITMPHGQPRTLKTWMIMEICRAASTADAAFGLDRFRVPAPIAVWYVTEEDPEIECRDRLESLFGGRDQSVFPDCFHLSIQRSIAFDDPAWQTSMIRYAINNGIRVFAVDPVRASSKAVDQGPREIAPLAAFLRKFMRETGAVVIVGHHDTKPQAATADNRAKPQRASGGGIFSIADAPIHLERLGLDSRSIVTPSHYKFAMAPNPFVITLEADDPKRPTWVRIQGSDASTGEADELVLHDKILDYLREHPSTSGSKVSLGIHARKDPTLAALEDLRERGLTDYFQRGQAKLWFVVASEATS
jgi:hypothetical protein